MHQSASVFAPSLDAALTRFSTMLSVCASACRSSALRAFTGANNLVAASAYHRQMAAESIKPGTISIASVSVSSLLEAPALKVITGTMAAASASVPRFYLRRRFPKEWNGTHELVSLFAKDRTALLVSSGT